MCQREVGIMNGCWAGEDSWRVRRLEWRRVNLSNSTFPNLISIGAKLRWCFFTREESLTPVYRLLQRSSICIVQTPFTRKQTRWEVLFFVGLHSSVNATRSTPAVLSSPEEITTSQTYGSWRIILPSVRATVFKYILWTLLLPTTKVLSNVKCVLIAQVYRQL